MINSTMRYVSRHPFSAVLLGLTVLSAASANAQIQERSLRFGSTLNEDHPQGQSIKYLADVVSRESNGKIKIALFARGKLGDDKTMTADLQKGTLDMTIPDSSTLVDLNKGFGVINFPYIFDREEDADLLLDGSFGSKLLDTLPAKGIVGLGWWENGFRNTSNNLRPIYKAKDFEGMKIRVMQNPLCQDTFQALGATPVALPFPQVFNALKEQKVDAQENPVITILSSKFYEVQKYLTLTRHIYSTWPLLISKKTWDSFSPDEQKLFRKAAREATLFERKTIREANSKTIADLQKAGMKVNELMPSELAHFRQLLRPVTKNYREVFGQNWTDDFYMGRMQIEMDRLKDLNKP